MARFVVNLPEYMTHRKMTPGQFLAEFAEHAGPKGAPPTYMLLPKPVKIGFAERDETPHVETCRTASAVFALFQRIHICQGAIFSLSWRGCGIGPRGLYELNRAIREHAIRKGGLNIVRHWLETRRGCRTPIGVDLAALFDYLEIRPLFRGETPRRVSPTPPEEPSTAVPVGPNAITYVYNT